MKLCISMEEKGVELSKVVINPTFSYGIVGRNSLVTFNFQNIQSVTSCVLRRGRKNAFDNVI
jgi:hypothetical protein